MLPPKFCVVLVMLLVALLSGCASPSSELPAVALDPSASTPADAPAPSTAAAEPIMYPEAPPLPTPIIYAAPSTPAIASLGLSRQGRSLDVSTYGAGATRVYVIASIHGDESEGRSALQHLQNHLNAASLDATIRLVHDMNPDGSAAGTRTASSGVDLNRNWPATNFKKTRGNGPSALSEPEAAAVHADILAFDPHFIMVLHSARGGPFVNFDGPQSAAALAEQFAAAARSAGDARWKTVADMGYPTPGSMGSYFGKDRQLPILTVEFRRGDPEERIPAALVAGLGGTLADKSVALIPLSQIHSATTAAVTEAASLGTSASEPSR